ncbi:hypothetical protein V8G54_005873 [Vigna mungo]|uniref:Uncharacterized protein n=1 Tax=Vigna mungo TaxID=3915 RepID=A0AAQ3NXY2_VIGMU
MVTELIFPHPTPFPRHLFTFSGFQTEFGVFAQGAWRRFLSAPFWVQIMGSFIIPLISSNFFNVLRIFALRFLFFALMAATPPSFSPLAPPVLLSSANCRFSSNFSFTGDDLVGLEDVSSDDGDSNSIGTGTTTAKRPYNSIEPLPLMQVLTVDALAGSKGESVYVSKQYMSTNPSIQTLL